ncbi:MAG: glycosyltransferase family 87 protein [Pseudomonadota bacterium]
MLLKLKQTAQNAPLALLLLIVAIPSYLSKIGNSTPDVSWLTDMCARILNGEQAYVDIFETTPPVPTLLYMPAAAIEHYFALPAEPFALLYITLFFVGILTYAERLAPKELKDIGAFRYWIIAPAALFIFVLTNDAYAQRETIALAAMLPLISVSLWRIEGNAWPGLRTQIIIGCLAGFGAAVKPPIFALPLLVLGGVWLFRERRFDVLLKSGLFVSGVFAVSLTVLSLAVFPDYLSGIVPLMKEIYVPTKMGLLSTVGNPSFRICILTTVVTFIFVRKGKVPSSLLIPAVFGLSFFAIHIMQGKMFAYHAIPAEFFTLIALSMAIGFHLNTINRPNPKMGESTDNLIDVLGLVRSSRSTLSGAAVGAAIFMTMAVVVYTVHDDEPDPIKDYAWAEDLEAPTALGITPSIYISFPLARKIDAIWVDRIHSQWVIHYANMMASKTNVSTEQRALYNHWRDSEIKRVVNLVKTKQPEIIIQCVMPGAKILNRQFLAFAPDLLDAYEPITEQGGIRVLRRRTAIEASNINRSNSKSASIR